MEHAVLDNALWFVGGFVGMMIMEAPLLLGASQYIMAPSGSSAWGEGPTGWRRRNERREEAFWAHFAELFYSSPGCDGGGVVVGRPGEAFSRVVVRLRQRWCGMRQGADCSLSLCAPPAETQGIRLVVVAGGWLGAWVLTAQVLPSCWRLRPVPVGASGPTGNWTCHCTCRCSSHQLPVSHTPILPDLLCSCMGTSPDTLLAS
jgi:hypothetical protein